jgi:hypothetical protein
MSVASSQLLQNSQLADLINDIHILDFFSLADAGHSNSIYPICTFINFSMGDGSQHKKKEKI